MANSLENVRRERRDKIRNVQESWSDLTPVVNITNQIGHRKDSAPPSLIPSRWKPLARLAFKILGALAAAGVGGATLKALVDALGK